ncbi:hypothetical protein KIL84_013057, partial [Mauremys mutica]
MNSWSGPNDSPGYSLLHSLPFLQLLKEYMDSNKYIERLVTQLEEQRWNLW